ncbi:hypothetical protein EJK15_44000 [Nonomuraea basaltis]|nr:hypothetical protein EJK15_44000 [Nonomuraea basaltis]
MITPSGGRWCGLPERGHFQRWTAEARWHGYTPPTQEQIKQRMLTRAPEPTPDRQEDQTR